MNYNCKYCDYVDKCSRKCEYNSLLCKMNGSFPKVVERPYKEVLYKNSDLKLKLERQSNIINKLKNYLDKSGSICLQDIMDILNGRDELL